MFTVEIRDIQNDGGQSVEIYLDDEGLRDLLQQLSFLQKGHDHTHLFTEEWGADPLTSVLQGPGNTLVNHLKIIKV